MRAFLITLFIVTLCILNSCLISECGLVDCVTGTSIEFNIVQEGENILQQPNSREIKFRKLSNNLGLFYTSDDNIIAVEINDNSEYILMVDDLSFRITTKGDFLDDKCCNPYIVEELFIDGTSVCTGDNCQEIITIAF